MAYLYDEGPRSFGSVMLWTWRNGHATPRLVVDRSADPGGQARRMASMASAGSTFVVDEAGAVSPAEPTPPATVDLAADIPGSVAALLAGLGVDLLVDGDHRGLEFRGLEVGRLVGEGDEAEIEAGVGATDREANRVLSAGVAGADVLARVVAEVARHRRSGAGPHPLATMARSAWLAEVIGAQPGLVGAAEVRRLAPTTLAGGCVMTSRPCRSRWPGRHVAWSCRRSASMSRSSGWWPTASLASGPIT
ncbi:MAG: hypothetical protein R2695_05090 [Acidimicrobiales bacterium]